MKFAIRDDDTNYFTSPEELTRSYAQLWDLCPISLSVIAFVNYRFDKAIEFYLTNGRLSEELTRIEKVHAIGDNRCLTSFLKKTTKEHRTSVNLHGIHHRNNENTKEFYTDQDFTEALKRAKDYLEALLETKISTFVPPHNVLSAQGYSAVINNNLNLVGWLPFKHRFLRLAYVPAYLKLVQFRLGYGDNVYPYVLRLGSRSEAMYHSLTPAVSFETLTKAFDFAYRMDGIFILATHYWELNAKQCCRPHGTVGEVLFRFMDYVSRHSGIRYCTVNEVFANSAVEALT
jgi:hypothetical protein